MNTKLVLQILYEDVFFYLLSALLFVGYLWIVTWNQFFSTLLFFLLLFLIWIITTRHLFLFLKRPFLLLRSSLLLLGIILYTLSLIIVANTTLVAFLDLRTSLLLSSFVLAFLLMGIFIPLFVGGILIFHHSLFHLPKKYFFSHLQTCSTIFCSMTIFVLALRFLPEETELVLSGVLLMIYFAWQKAYMLS